MADDPALLPLWPRRGGVEVIEWLTDVGLFEDGNEERLSLRTPPRHELRLAYKVPVGLQRRVANLLYGGRRRQWYVPLWPQVQSIGAITAGATSIAADVDYGEFAVGLSVLIWQSADLYQIAQIADIDDGALAIDPPALEFADASLVPLRLGYLTRDPNRALNGRDSVLDMEFALEENTALDPAAPAQFEGHDIYTDAVLLDGGSTPEQIAARFDLFDEQLGPVAYRFPWIDNRVRRVHRMLAETPAEGWAIREFLHRRAGRYRPFWQPSFEADLQLTSTGVIGTTIAFRDDGYLANATARRHIAIETAEGWFARTISNPVAAGGGVTQATLSSALGQAAASVRRISFLGLKRLDTDRCEINWNAGHVASCSVPTVEIEP